MNSILIIHAMCKTNKTHYPVRCPTNITHIVRATRATVLGTNTRPPLVKVSLLVLPKCNSKPLWPFDVASNNGSTDTVTLALDVTVVENVRGVAGVSSVYALSVRKTRAKPGAGTLTWQMLFVQVTVTTLKLPRKRPSDSKVPPKLYSMVEWHA